MSEEILLVTFSLQTASPQLAAQQAAVRVFSDYLRLQAVPHRLVRSHEGIQLYVPELHAQQVLGWLQQYQEQPSRFRAVSWQQPDTEPVVIEDAVAGVDLSAAADSPAAAPMAAMWQAFLQRSGGVLTRTVALLCALLFLIELWGGYDWLYGGLSYPQQGVQALWSQPWRLFTPVLLHGSLLHALFNVLWWLLLAGVVERFHGRLRLLQVLLVTALVANFAQFLARGPDFVGLSGVVYGVLGYLWCYGLSHPSGGLQLRPAIVIFMLGWMVLGFVLEDWLPIANMAHLAGLLSGAGLGLFFGGLSRIGYILR